MIRYEYYEIIGGDLFGLDPMVLFMPKKGMGNIPLYRQLMMYYRRVEMKMTFSEAAGRYHNRDHATAIHAEKKINGYLEIGDVFMTSIHDNFMKLCAIEIRRRMGEDSPLAPSEIKASEWEYDKRKLQFYECIDSLRYHMGFPREQISGSPMLRGHINRAIRDLEYFKIQLSKKGVVDELGDKETMGGHLEAV